MKTHWIQILFAKHIVQHDAQFRNEVPAALPIGRGDAGGISLFIQNAHMGCSTPGKGIILWVANRKSWIEQIQIFVKDLGVNVTNRIQQLKVEEPPKRKGGIKVKTVAELVSKLKNEAKVI